MTDAIMTTLPEFNYDPTLTLEQNVLNLGAAYQIYRGLRYSVPQNISAKIVTIAGVKLKELEEPIAAELMSKQLITRHMSNMNDARTSMLTASAVRFYETNTEVFKDYADAYHQLVSGEISDAVVNDSQLNLLMRELVKETREAGNKLASDSELLQLLLTCYFLTQRAAEDVTFVFDDTNTEGRTVDLYSLAASENKALTDFMAEAIGWGDKKGEEEETDDADVKVLLEEEQKEEESKA